jgi:hypothetical protein
MSAEISNLWSDILRTKDGRRVYVWCWENILRPYECQNWKEYIISTPVPWIFYYFVLWPTNAQSFHILSHCYMFRHYRVIFREFLINILPSYTSISSAVVGQQLQLEYVCNLARYWLQAPWRWHDSVETCSSVIICEMIVHLFGHSTK